MSDRVLSLREHLSRQLRTSSPPSRPSCSTSPLSEDQESLLALVNKLQRLARCHPASLAVIEQMIDHHLMRYESL